jgi:serine/threonine protein kinase
LLGGSTPVGPLWTLGSALARVLAAIHTKGIVHCDVKPSNLLVHGHDVRVIDFGSARYVGEPCADDGIVHCTRGWAAPEQLRAAPATPAIDVFAWGCLLAHLASGVHPFASRSEQEWILRIQAAEPDLFGLPPDLEDLIRWTLARNPGTGPTHMNLPRSVTRAVTNDECSRVRSLHHVRPDGRIDSRQPLGSSCCQHPLPLGGWSDHGAAC